MFEIVVIIAAAAAIVVYIVLYMRREKFTQRQIDGAYVLHNIHDDISKNQGRFTDYKKVFNTLGVDEYQAVVDRCGNTHCDKNTIAAMLDTN